MNSYSVISYLLHCRLSMPANNVLHSATFLSELLMAVLVLASEFIKSLLPISSILMNADC